MPDRIVDLPVANQLLDDFERHKHLIPGQEVGRAESAEPGVTLVKMAMPEAPGDAAVMTTWFARTDDGTLTLSGIEYLDADGHRIT